MKNISKIASILIILFLLGVIIFFSILLYYSKDLPHPESFKERRLTEPTRIYDRSGEHLLYTIFGEEKRTEVPLDEVSEYFQKAIITSEDRDFYTHFGVDIQGLFRAVTISLIGNRRIRGTSTIPQQLIRSTFLTMDRTIERKVREIILSIELDRKYPKDQILEWYVNQIPFGSNAYGIEAASQTFFGKPASDLNLSEAATLAPLIQAPTTLSPYGPHRDTLIKKRDRLLNDMVKQGYVTQEEADKAKVPLELKVSKTLETAPHFVLDVRERLVKMYGEEYLKNKGLKVYTTLDYDLQKKAEDSVRSGAEQNKYMDAHNAALVAIDPKTGQIVSFVGNKDYFSPAYPEDCRAGVDCQFDPHFNVARMGKRQPGSSFKPIVYSVAFEKDYTPKDTVVDEETSFGVWGGEDYVPQNYDGEFRGEVTLREALAQSLNVPAVKVLLNMAGIEDSVRQAKEMGITTLRSPSFYGPSLVLGGGEVTLLDMTSAYSVFADKGIRHDPYNILKIEDKEGNIVESFEPSSERVLDTGVTEMITDVLSDNQARSPMFGYRSVLYINDETAVKTGTTQFYNDAWTIGYNDEIAVGVWVGNNDNSPSNKKPGSMLSGPIWNSFMTK